MSDDSLPMNGAEVALQSPETRDDGARYAVLLLCARKRVGVFLELRLTGRDAPARQHAAGELDKALRKHPLAAVDVDDALIVDEIWRRLCEGIARYALGLPLPA